MAALQKFSGVRPHPEAFVEALEPLQPRLYSISSSHNATPGKLSLTVDCVRYVVGKRKRMGLASTFLAERVQTCIAAGIARERLCIDPGFGFGKLLAHNLQLLRDLAQFERLGLPLAVGLSRKSMVTALGARSHERLAGSLALATIAVLQGVQIVRAHDVAATVDAVRVADAVRRRSSGG